MILLAAAIGLVGWGELPDAASLAGGALILLGRWLPARGGRPAG